MEKLVRKIGLVAHDAMKKDLIEWVLWNSELLMGHKFYCTGTTGTLILEALREKHPDVEWDFTILKSGPLGGDQQMGSRIVDGEIDYLFFFTDPMTLQPHDTDVKALTRLAGDRLRMPSRTEFHPYFFRFRFFADSTASATTGLFANRLV